MKIFSSARLLIIILLVMIASGCAAPAAIVRLEPNPEVARQMSVEQAREYVKQGFQGGSVHHVFSGTLLVFTVSGVEITPDTITVNLSTGKNIYPSIIRLEGMHIFGFSGDVTIIDRDWQNKEGQTFLRVPVETRGSLIDKQRIVDALLALKLAAEKEAADRKAAAEKEDEARFQKGLRMYKTAGFRPELTEEMRKYKIQAEGAVRDKDFNGAEAFYGQALLIAPWWTEGRFNRALVLGELGKFDTAIKEMKRYLALVPGASNSRAAQDRIYDWERKAGSTGK